MSARGADVRSRHGLDAQLHAFFESLPGAAWLVDKTDWHVAHGNTRGAAHLDGRATCGIDELDELLEFPDDPGASIGRRIAAAFSANEQARVPVRIRQSPSSRLTLVSWPLLVDGAAAAVGLLVLDESGSPARRTPIDWWLRVGHDLRGPITPIRMAVQLLKGGRIDATDKQDALRMIDRQLDQLLDNVQDVADLLRIEAGAFALRARPDDLNLVVDLLSGRTSLLNFLDERQQRLHCLGFATDVVASHDPVRLVALLEYLLRKSAGHAPRGAVLTLSLQADGGRARFMISGMTASILTDPDLAYIAGSVGDGFAEAAAKAVLMHEVARLSGAIFAPIDGLSVVSFTLPVTKAQNFR